MTRYGVTMATVGVLLLAAMPADAGPRGRPGGPAGFGAGRGMDDGARGGGMPTHRMRRLRAQARDADLLRALGLTDAQRATLDEVRGQAKVVRQDLAKEVRLLRAEAETIGMDAEVRAAVRDRAKAARESALRAVEPAAQRFVGSLTAEQKQRATTVGAKDEAALVARVQHLIFAGGPDPKEQRILEGLRHRAMHGALRLDDAQRRAFHEARKAAQGARETLHSTVRDAFLKSDRSPQAREAVAATAKTAREAALAAVEPAARTFVEGLTPEQKKRVADLAAKHGGTADDAGLVAFFQAELVAREGPGARGPGPGARGRRGAGPGMGSGPGGMGPHRGAGFGREGMGPWQGPGVGPGPGFGAGRGGPGLHGGRGRMGPGGGWGFGPGRGGPGMQGRRGPMGPGAGPGFGPGGGPTGGADGAPECRCPNCDGSCGGGRGPGAGPGPQGPGPQWGPGAGRGPRPGRGPGAGGDE